jgi:hypothetical protein
MRASSCTKLALLFGASLLLASCDGGRQTCDTTFEIDTRAGCVRALTIDCSFEGGVSAPTPPNERRLCADGPALGPSAPTADLTFSECDPIACAVTITCDTGSVEVYELDVEHGSVVSSGGPSGWSVGPLSACASASADGGTIDAD